MVGSRIAHYEVLDRLGKGGMGVVYKARDLRLDRIVALKVLAPDHAQGDEERRRFLREARAVSALDHPNVCTVYEIGETETGAPFLAMTFCAGETLKRRIARGALPLAEAVGIAEQLAAGLAAAHERGIVHRDVKPSNVIVSPSGHVTLVDFGVAKLPTAATALTRQGKAVGTPLYMSPEQLRGEPVDARSDVWSFGVVLYEMLAGRLPFEGASESDVVHSMLVAQPVPLRERFPDITPGIDRIDRIILRALAKNPAGRYASIAELRLNLLGLGDGEAGDGTEETLVDGARATPSPTPRAVPGELAGRQILHFRILDSVGSGSMGVVYRAEDTRLARRVALKFLAPELGRDRATKQRFLIEARAASALDHPNVCTILEVGESEEGLLFLAMPYYDGENLERRIARGPRPVDEALDVARQAAQGLAKAHRHGIVHRDVKPANLFLTDEGLVKILDFGIAKLAGTAGPTRHGAFLGTPAYMAPEQARGQEVDARTDVWALGGVLYEMLAGRRPFLGGTEAAVIHSILLDDPEPLERFRPEVPPAVARLVHRMLAKDPAQRPAEANEVVRELREIQGLTASGSQTWTVTGTPRRRLLRAMPLVLASSAAIAAIAAVGTVMGLLAWRHKGAETGFGPATFTRLTDMPGKESFSNLSPDGNFFLYVRTVDGRRGIYLQRVGGGNPIALTAGSAVDNTQPAFSPDGQQIAFRSERDGGGIFLMGATGESVRRLTDLGYNPAWSPDGKEIAVATEGVSTPLSRFSRSRILRVSVANGAKRPLEMEDGVQPAWSPHGLRLAFWGITAGGHRVISTIPVDGGTPVPVADDTFYNWSPAWSPDGSFLYFASDRGGSMNLWRIPLDEASGRVLGKPQAVTTPAEWSALPSFSRDGRRILYATDDSRSFLERVPLDPEEARTAGPPAVILEGARRIRGCDVSPDGEQIVFRTSAPQEDLYLIRADGRDLRQLTNDPARDRGARWSPDGRLILFSSNRSGNYEAWTIRPDGSGLTQITHSLRESANTPFWAPDGRQIGFTFGSLGTALLDLRGRPPAPPRLLTGEAGKTISATSWSGDGRWLAGMQQRPDSLVVPGIVLWSLAEGSLRQLTPTGAEPLFFHDGKRLLYSDAGALRVADRVTAATRELLSPPPHSAYLTAGIGAGDRMLCAVRTTDEGDVWLLSLSR